jgi:hypothetical protein
VRASQVDNNKNKETMLEMLKIKVQQKKPHKIKSNNKQIQDLKVTMVKHMGILLVEIIMEQKEISNMEDIIAISINFDLLFC